MTLRFTYGPAQMVDCTGLPIQIPFSLISINYQPPAESFSIVIYEGLFPASPAGIEEKREMILLEMKQQQHFLLDERRLFN